MTRAILAGAAVLGARRVETAAYAESLGVPAPRGVKQTRIADADEDTVTLAVSAARRTLAHAEAPPDEIFLILDADEAAASVVTEALCMPPVAVSRFTATAESAADALLVALARDADENTLVVASSDARAGATRPHAAAGAVALLVGTGSGLRLLDEAHARHQHGQPTLSDLAHEACGRLKEANASTDVVAVAEEAPLAAQAWLPKEHAARVHRADLSEVGDLGCAAPYASLLAATAAGGADRHVVWIVPGVNAVLAARWRVEDTARLQGVPTAIRAPSATTEAVVAVRAREAWRGAEHDLAQGAFVSPQLYLSQAAARYGLRGQRCEACGTLVFPPREGCPECGAGPLAPFPFSGRGTVYARTLVARGAAPTEFSRLQEAVGAYQVAVVQLDEGPRVAAMVAGSTAALPIGAPVEMAFRLLYVQDGMRRYGFKAVPAAATAPRGHGKP